MLMTSGHVVGLGGSLLHVCWCGKPRIKPVRINETLSSGRPTAAGAVRRLPGAKRKRTRVALHPSHGKTGRADRAASGCLNRGRLAGLGGETDYRTEG